MFLESYPILSYPILSYPILSYPTLTISIFNTCREDVDLISALKLIRFIPTWNSTQPHGESARQNISAINSTYGASSSSASTSASAPTSSSFPTYSVASSSASSFSSVFPTTFASFPPLPSTSLDYHTGSLAEYRKADEMISWNNADLLEALKGGQQSR